MYFALHRIGRSSLTKRVLSALYIYAYVTSRLDMNNGLLYGLPDSTIAPLQRL